MTAYLQAAYGVETVFGRGVRGIGSAKDQFRALLFGDHPPLEADLAVVSTGADAHELCKASGFGRLVWPVRGYSLTIEANEHAPKVSLTDVRRKLAFARIGDRLRVAGFPDIAPRSATFASDRFACLVRLANEALPKAVPATIGGGLAWCGERPSTPSSVPLIGQSRSLRGLYVNIGHGILGWTLALGSAARILRIVQAVRVS